MADNRTPPTAEEEAGQDVYEKFVERVNEIQSWCPACGGSGMVMEFGPTDCPNLESHRMLAYLTEQIPASWIIQSAQQRFDPEGASS
jgi:hypothetical protein